jgi:hypothetical protein
MVARDTAVAPPPPAGYQPAERFEFPKTGLAISSIGLFIVLIPLLWQLTWLLQRQRASTGTIELVGWYGLALLGLVLLTPVITIVIHELIHGLVFQAFGYRVSYGVYWKLGAYAAAFGQFQQRNHTIVVALAPLVVISVAMLPLLASDNSLVVICAYVALLVNTSGAVGDIYLTWYLLRVPPATLGYDIDVENSFFYRPE